MSVSLPCQREAGLEWRVDDGVARLTPMHEKLIADGLLQAAEAGATAVIQPGGSMKDDEVIRAADERGLAMVFTGIRHFRH